MLNTKVKIGRREVDLANLLLQAAESVDLLAEYKEEGGHTKREINALDKLSSDLRTVARKDSL